MIVSGATDVLGRIYADFTGRENIMLGGRYAGLSRTQTRRLVDDGERVVVTRRRAEDARGLDLKGVARTAMSRTSIVRCSSCAATSTACSRRPRPSPRVARWAERGRYR